MVRDKCAKNGKRLSGAVLIMVVTVMFVLIIMLLATLTVVSTAQNRYYTKYEENQAYYTARSALDVFAGNLLSDSDYYAYDTSGVKTYTHGNAQSANMKQGLALQLDLYKIKAQSGDNIAQTALTSYANSLSSTDKRDEYKNYYGTDNSVTSGIQTDASGNEYIEYEVTNFPAVSSSSNNYGKMVDTNSGKVAALIKVEVLDRSYNMNESKISDGTYADRAALLASSDGAKAVADGNRSEDKMRIKITSTVTFMGVEGTAVLVYDSTKPKAITTSRAVTSLSDLSSGSGMFPIGGASALSEGTVQFNDDSIVSGSLYLQGSFADKSNNSIYIDGSTIIFAKKDITLTNKLPIVKEPGATLFAGEKMSINLANDFGDSANSVNLLAGTLEIGGNSPKIYGNVFCNVLDLKDANVSNMNVTGKLYANTLIAKSSFSEYSDATGTTVNITVDLPSSFMINLSSSAVKLIHPKSPWSPGDSDWEADYDLNSGTISNVTKDGSPYGDFYNVSLNGGMPNIDTSKIVNLDLSDYTQNTVSADFTRTFTMPDNLIPAPGGTATDTIEIPTVANLYKDYFDSSAFDANGNLAFSYSNPALTDAQKKAELDAFVASKIVTSESKVGITDFNKYSDYVTVEARNATAEAARPASEQIPAAFSSVITSSGKLKQSDNNGNVNNYGLIAIDARSGPIEIQINDNSVTGDTYYAGKFVVFGDNEVTFLIAGNKKVNLGSTAGSCVFEVYSSEIYSTTGLSLGNSASPTAAPKINIYVASTVPEVSMGTPSFIAGYFYMPLSVFGFAGGMNGKSYSTTYDGYSIGNVAYGVVGSVVCKSYTSAQKVGVAYIEPTSTSTPVGDPHLKWMAYQYTRN